MDVFAVDVLDAHNRLRKLHGVPPVTLNPKISAISKKWAEHLIKTREYEPSANVKYGENIFHAESISPKFDIFGEHAVKRWYRQMHHFKFGVEPKGHTSDNFTQVIWCGTRELGVGYAHGKGRIVVVVNYYPPGNIKYAFTENVPAIGFGPLSNMEECSIMSYIRPLLVRFSRFEVAFLKAHNKYRKLHGVPLLTVDCNLSEKCKERAAFLASQNRLIHRGDQQRMYGENLFMVTCRCKMFKAREPVKGWYAECNGYNYGRERYELEDITSHHFTQIVWKSTKHIGVGIADSERSRFLVAYYAPPGNYVGHFLDNVYPPIPKCCRPCGALLDPFLPDDMDCEPETL